MFTNKKYFKHKKALVGKKASVGKGTRIWAFTNILDGAVIGEGCNVCDGCFVEGGAVVGNNVTLKNGVYVFDGVTIEDDVFCGANVTFINDRYPRSKLNKEWVLERTSIKKGATIGSNATILCGLSVGEFSFVAAGSVVTKDVPAYSLVVGNPAEFRGYICRCGKKLSPENNCECGLRYAHDETGLNIKG